VLVQTRWSPCFTTGAEGRAAPRTRAQAEWPPGTCSCPAWWTPIPAVVCCCGSSWGTAPMRLWHHRTWVQETARARGLLRRVRGWGAAWCCVARWDTAPIRCHQTRVPATATARPRGPSSKVGCSRDAVRTWLTRPDPGGRAPLRAPVAMRHVDPSHPFATDAPPTRCTLQGPHMQPFSLVSSPNPTEFGRVKKCNLRSPRSPLRSRV